MTASVIFYYSISASERRTIPFYFFFLPPIPVRSEHNHKSDICVLLTFPPFFPPPNPSSEGQMLHCKSSADFYYSRADFYVEINFILTSHALST